MLDYLQHCAQGEREILREFCVTQCCFAMLRGAMQRAPRGKLLKKFRLTSTHCTHNAEVEGSSPSLTTINNELQLLNRGILRALRDFA